MTHSIASNEIYQGQPTSTNLPVLFQYFPLQVSRLLRWIGPVVFPSIAIADRQPSPVLWRESVQTADVDRHQLAAEFGNVDFSEWMDSTFLAEITTKLRVTVNIFRHELFPGSVFRGELELFGFASYSPPTGF